MSTACITSATATTTSLLTTDVVSTSFSTTVSTEPATTTTITTDVCASPLSINITDITCIPTPSTFTSTILGNLTTVSVPFTTTVSTVETKTLTLFTTSCTVITSAGSSSSTSSSSSFRSTDSFSASVSTPPPVTFTSQVPTTLQNGDVSAVVQTFTSQPPLSTVYVPVPGPSAQVAQSGGDRSSTKMAPILGGIVGGFFGLLGIALIIWFILKRRRRWDDIFDTEGPPHSPGRRPTKRWSLDADMDPKPYQYGLVGQASSPSLGISRAESPPASSPSSQLRASPSSQLPRPNTNTLTPLLLPTSASTPGPSATTLSSRPSTAGSMRPLRDVAASSAAAGTDGSNHKQSASSTSVQPHVSPAMPSQWGHHSPSPSTDQMQMHFDFENERSGSPTSIREWEPQRRLQLANVGEDDDSIASPATASILDGKGPRQGHGRVGSTLSDILVDTGPAPSGSRP